MFEGKEIRFGSSLHQKIAPRLQARIDASRSGMSERYTRWAKDEDQFLAYMPTSENDALRKAKRSNGRPQYTTIQIPHSYATVLTGHTYLSSVFLGRSPILDVQGRHGESEMQTLGLSSVLDYQVGIGGQLPARYIWLLDALKYGLGVIYTYWDEETIRSGRYEKVPVTFMGEPIPGRFKREFIAEETKGFAGTKVFNVRPQDWLPDPRYSFHRFQESEFCGRWFQSSILDMQDAAGETGEYFNLDKLRGSADRQGLGNHERGSARVKRPGDTIGPDLYRMDESMGMADNIELQVRLVPSEWGLGSRKLSEKWVFTYTNESVITGCRPLGWYHDKFTFDVLEQEVSGHGLSNRSALEVIQPLNEVLDWLVNTHFYNVRASLNNQLIVDPSMVSLRDLEDPAPGFMARLKPQAYGKDVRSMVTQLPVADMTRTHVQDSQIVADLLQKVSGVNDNLMGMVNQGGRKTATEVRSSNSFGINRMKTIAEYMSAMGWGPQCQKMVQMTQQMLDEERAYRIVGDMAQWGTERYVRVNPAMISGFYDFIQLDGSMPVDRFAQVNMWANLMGQLKQFPQVMQQYDFGKVFAWVAQLGGIKNINQFRVQVMDPAMLQQQAQMGNSVPMSGSEQLGAAGVNAGRQLALAGPSA